MNKDISIVIPSYRSKLLILSHLKKLSKKYKIIIIENSYDKSLKKIIENNYKNVEIYLKKNIGYGRAVNFAAKKIKTKFFFVMNPDTKIYRDTLLNLIKAAKKINNFGAIGPINKFDKINNKNKIFKVKKIVSAAMMFETKTFNKINGYDENFFLYYEDNDLFLRCNNLNLKIYYVTNSFITHVKYNKKINELKLHSTTFSNLEEKESTYFVGGWHGQWSKFYFFKKNKGFLQALGKCLPGNLINMFQIILFILIDFKKAKYKFFKLYGFVCSFLGLPSFKRSKFDNEYFL